MRLCAACVMGDVQKVVSMIADGVNVNYSMVGKITLFQTLQVTDYMMHVYHN